MKTANSSVGVIIHLFCDLHFVSIFILADQYLWIFTFGYILTK